MQKNNYLTLSTKIGSYVQVRGDNGTTLKLSDDWHDALMLMGLIVQD